MEREAKALAMAKRMGPAREVGLEEANSLKAEAETLKDTTRPEDLQIRKIGKEKTTEKGTRTYTNGWPLGVKAPRCVMSIWAAAGKWMLQLQG